MAVAADRDDPFLRPVFISAWNESGGGYLHRLFDGASTAFVLPFECQLGDDERRDGYAEWFSAKVRFTSPTSPVRGDSAAHWFDRILDQELRDVLTAGSLAKHRDFPVDFTLDDLRQAYLRNIVSDRPERRAVLSAYLKAIFDCWRDRPSTGRERCVLGHCPTLILDADEILETFPHARIIHQVRSPMSGFADFRRRVPEMTAERFAAKWSIVNAVAAHTALKHPERVVLTRFEALLQVNDREATMRRLCNFVGMDYESQMLLPTWNSRPLERMYPFGGVPEISLEHESTAAAMLSETDVACLERLTAAVAGLLPWAR